MSSDSGFSGPAAPTPDRKPRDQAEERRLQLRRQAERDRARRIRWVIVAVVAGLFASAWWFRWEVVPLGTGPGRAGLAYALDRLTGTIYWLDSGNSTAVIRVQP